MKILLINKFLYPKGGDAICTLKTGNLLAAKGHEVIYWGMQHPLNPGYPYSNFFVSNIDFDAKMNFFQKTKASLNIMYSFEAKRKLSALLGKVRPDIVHLNNFAHQISPSVLDAVSAYGIPAVMTMHDYKLICPSYLSWLDGKFCNRCNHGGRYYNCFLNRCTKNSYAKSLVNTLEMYLHHSVLRLYNKIDVYISPSRFLREKIGETGFRKDVVHISNFINTEEYEPAYECAENNFVYVGRLSREKGLDTLFDAFRDFDGVLKVIGSGELERHLKERIEKENLGNVILLGYKKGEELRNEIKKSIGVVLPSEWNENNPLVVLEAFALGKPVIGSDVGGIPELVSDGKTGLMFKCADASDLRKKLKILAADKKRAAAMGMNARKYVEEHNSPGIYYAKLIEAYRLAAKNRAKVSRTAENMGEFAWKLQ